MNHTPGPWHVEWGNTVKTVNNVIVADVVKDEDAALIAAAPLLLEALDNIVGSGERFCDCDSCSECNAWHAIKKARGDKHD
jgi:hypothetical protein